MTNADWLISPRLLKYSLAFERAGKDGEDQRDRAGKDSIRTRFFFVSRVTRDASACEKHFPPVISGESGRRPPPRRFAPRGRTSPYSPEMTGGSYISRALLRLVDYLATAPACNERSTIATSWWGNGRPCPCPRALCEGRTCRR